MNAVITKVYSRLNPLIIREELLLSVLSGWLAQICLNPLIIREELLHSIVEDFSSNQSS